jgi:hypothetical protein
VNDLEAIAELAADAPLPPLSQLSVPRARLDAAIAAEMSGAGTRIGAGTVIEAGSRARHSWTSRRRVVVGGAAAAGVGAAAVVALAVSLPGGAPRTGGQAAGPVPATTPVSARVSGAPVSTAPRKPEPSVPAAKLTAKQVLDTAAAAALTESPVTPRPSQYVYVKINNGDGIAQSWYSVDGRHNGLSDSAGLPPLVLPGCLPDGHYAWTGPAMPPPSALKKLKKVTSAQRAAPEATSGSPQATAPCSPQPAYFPDMPTTASAIGSWLAKTEGATTANLNDLAKTAGTILEDDYLLPAQRAALYEFLATTPGLTVVHGVSDILGRAGVGITWRFSGSATLVFDAGTLAYLGWNTVGLHGEKGGDALLATAIVDRAGELPNG